jgi:uncharacterized LabA/DUF88 family protein
VEPRKNLAVLIDGDNASPKLVETLLARIDRFGAANLRRVYGDWTTPNLKSWKECLLDFAIQPMQQFGYTTGKNSTDCALIIDAMDLLHTRKYDGFCIVSSDSDYTRLAVRLREDGLKVYGFGNSNTPYPFIAACDEFVLLENHAAPNVQEDAKQIVPTADKPVIKAEPKKQPVPKTPAKPVAQSMPKELVALLKAAFAASGKGSAPIGLGEFGTKLRQLAPDFVPKTYGYKLLSSLVKASGIMDVKRAGPGNSFTVQLKPQGNVVHLSLAAVNPQGKSG